jgi:hypothetical protein
MAVLELVHSRPDWMGALTVALTRPPGIPERRAGDDPWQEGNAAGVAERPRRISDDLAWLRQAMDEPDDCGLRHLGDTAAVGAWEPDDDAASRLLRLRDRRVLDAAGFLLHTDAEADAA